MGIGEGELICSHARRGWVTVAMGDAVVSNCAKSPTSVVMASLASCLRHVCRTWGLLVARSVSRIRDMSYADSSLRVLNRVPSQHSPRRGVAGASQSSGSDSDPLSRWPEASKT